MLLNCDFHRLIGFAGCEVLQKKKKNLYKLKFKIQETENRLNRQILCNP